MDMSTNALHSPDAENAVLSALLLDPNRLGEVGGLTYQDFFDRQLGAIFRALTEGGPASSVALADRAAAFVPGEYADLIAGLVRVRGFATSGLADAARIVRDRSGKRRLLSIDLSFVQSPDLPLDEAVERAISLMRGIHPKEKMRGFVDAASLMPEIIDEIESRGLTTPPVSGLIDLDAMIYGIRGGRLITVGARTGLGKSLFAGQWGLGAIANGHRVGFSALEMRQTEVLLRLLASQGGLNSSRLFGQLPLGEQDLSRLLQSMKWSQWPLLHFCDSARLQSEILFQIRRLKDEFPDLKAVVLDYLQIVKPDNPRLDKRLALAELTAALKELANDLEIDVMALSQVNRDCIDRKDKRPLINDISEGDAITHNSDVVLLLHREEYYDPDTTERGIFEINVAKHRNGPTGTVRMLYDKETQTLKNLKR
jgi:replicative DNA helicase